MAINMEKAKAKEPKDGTQEGGGMNLDDLAAQTQGMTPEELTQFTVALAE